MQLKGNRKISLLSFDLDGTLLNSANEISESTLRKVHEVMGKGVHATISSGRIPTMQQVFISLLGFNGPYIACNGAIILNSTDNSVLFSQPIASDVLRRLCAYAADIRLHVCLQTMSTMFYTKNNPRLYLLEEYDRVAVKYGSPRVPVQFLDDDYGNFDGRPTYKVLIYTPEKEKYNQLTAYLDQEPELAYSFSGPNLFEVCPRGIDKGMGLQRVAEFYNIPLSEVCAFGDYDNDIRIFEKAGTGIAMGNGSDNLKAVAEFVTDTNDNDGISKAIEAMERSNWM